MTGDLDAAIAVAVDTAVADGDLAGPQPLRCPVPPATSHPSATAAGRPVPPGTWRPVPPGAGGGPGSYATTIPFVLASQTAADPAQVAAVLAARLRSRAEISQVAVTGGGYLSITVTQDALARLAVRISQAGPGCARSHSLNGTRVSAPRDARLSFARTWPEACQRLGAELAGRLAAAAGAELTWTHPPAAGSPLDWTQPPAGGAERNPTRPPRPGPVADAIAFAGEDAIRFALSRTVPGRPGPGRRMPPIDLRAVAAQHLGNPAYAVRYAHAHAASAVRQAADLGLPRGDAERFQPRLLAHPSERALLDAMSWLPERVAGAARRRQPQVLAAFLADLAGKYLDCQEDCPAMQPGALAEELLVAEGPQLAEGLLVADGPQSAGGSRVAQGRQPMEGPHVAQEPRRLPGHGLPQQGGNPLLSARLWLADAARTALGAGLGLLGVAAPGRR